MLSPAPCAPPLALASTPTIAAHGPLFIGIFPKQARRARLQLFQASPLCYWCHSLTIWPDFPQAALGLLPDDTATLDHLFHARDRPRGHSPVVLACYACNQFRARLNAYAAKAWPLSPSQFALLTTSRAAYSQRLALTSADLAPGHSVLASEWTKALSNLALTASILNSPLLSNFPDSELTALRHRVEALSGLPPALIF
jgi:hypothetical protein